MGPLSYMRSVMGRNVVMRRMTVLSPDDDALWFETCGNNECQKAIKYKHLRKNTGHFVG